MVRTVQPVLADIPREVEEAAACLGSSRLQVFRHILVPALLPAWLTGFALAFARGVGEYGSVIFIAGNMPMKTEILPLLIMVKLRTSCDLHRYYRRDWCTDAGGFLHPVAADQLAAAAHRNPIRRREHVPIVYCCRLFGQRCAVVAVPLRAAS